MLLESVSIPTNCDKSATCESDSICLCIPSFWSLNHQPLPNWILPEMSSCWKQFIMVAKTSLSRGFKQYKMVRGSSSVWSKLPKIAESFCAKGWSLIESKPVSAPSVLSARRLLFRSAPIWYCCAQPCLL